MPIISNPTPADRVYSRLGPIAHGDEEAGYPLYGLIEALTVPQDPLEEIVREDDTHPAWCRAVDPHEVPLWALPWLAQLVGVEFHAPPSEALRTKTIERPNYRRGTVPAIQSAAGATLTGTKTVYVGVRDGGNPWRMTVGTLATETPNPAWTLSQILSEKPAGVVAEVLVNLAAWTYLAIWASYQDIAEVDATFATYTDLAAGP